MHKSYKIFTYKPNNVLIYWYQWMSIYHKILFFWWGSEMGQIRMARFEWRRGHISSPFSTLFFQAGERGMYPPISLDPPLTILWRVMDWWHNRPYLVLLNCINCLTTSIHDILQNVFQQSKTKTKKMFQWNHRHTDWQ